jgi:hypothetical protein
VSWRAWVCAVASLAFACERPPPPPRASSLGSDAARVGGIGISPGLVAQVSRASAIPPREALQGLVGDALAASAARSMGLDRESRVAWSSSVALARRVSLRAMDDASSRGAPRDEELQNLRVAHAIVLRSTRVSADRALAVAGAIQRAASGARSVEDFEARAKAVPHSDAQVLVERLDPFGPDGRTVPGGGELDPTFVAAAFLLSTPAEVSPVVETRFGWHVLFLVERTVSDEASTAQRRSDLTQSVFELRARGKMESLVRSRRQTVPIEVAGAAEALMAEVRSP